MISIDKHPRELDRLAQWHWFVLKNAPFEIEKRASKFTSDKTLSAEKRNFFLEIEKSLEELITARPARLEELNKALEPLYKSVLKNIALTVPAADLKKAKDAFKSQVNEIFNYYTFTQAANATYAYELAKRLNVNVCMYCNSQFTFTLHRPTGRTRPQFDHFYKKSRFPWLALSFYNLIPSCYICNSNLKGGKLFGIKTHLHPYLENMHEIMSFRTGVDAATFTAGNDDDFSIDLVPVPGADKKMLRKSTKNKVVFHLVPLYQMHKEYAGEIIKKTQWYNATRMKELKDDIGDGKLFASEEEVMRIALGNYLMPEHLGKRVLAKLTRDIANEFGFLKYIEDNP